MIKKISILVNGPGEMWGWARPINRELRKRDFHVSVHILPCQFSSGSEVVMAETMDFNEIHGCSNVFRTFQALGSSKTNCVLQLGGELLWGLLMKKAGKVPFLCYSYGYKKGMSYCDRVLTAYEEMAVPMRERGIHAEVVGDLVKNSMDLDEDTLAWEKDKTRKIVFLPGSRPGLRSMALPFLAATLKELKALSSDLEFRTLLPSFIEKEELDHWGAMGMNPTTLRNREFLGSADLVIAPPGTNNLEIMHSHAPALVVIPFSFLKSIPVSGALSLLERFPLGGEAMKVTILRRSERKAGFVSWPNRIAKKEIQKEIRGDITPKGLAMIIRKYLKDTAKLDRSRLEAISISSRSQGDGAYRIVELLEGMI